MIAPEGRASTTTYKSGQGAHQIHVLSGATPDAVLAHQVRVYLFYRKVGSTPDLQPVPGAVRRQLTRVYR